VIVKLTTAAAVAPAEEIWYPEMYVVLPAAAARVAVAVALATLPELPVRGVARLEYPPEL
jgi:hypothetical protein